MAGRHDPRLLYSIKGIHAFHLQNGDESSLTPSGPQTLSLLMVPTSSPFVDSPPSKQGQDHHDASIEDDFYLHLNLPPELDLPLPATTQIYHQPPRSYLIPRWDMGPSAGAFTRIEFPPIGHGAGTVTQEDIDTFETILAQCTAFLERAEPPSTKGGKIASAGKTAGAYNPASYAPGQGYVPGTGQGKHGQVVLVDEDNGSIVGELVEGAHVIEDPKLRQGTKTPVEIEISQDGTRVEVRPMSDDYLEFATHPAYRNSSLVQNAAAASRFIVTTSTRISTMLSSSADSFTQKTKPLPQPMSFTPAAHARARKIHSFTQGAAGLSSRTAGQVGKYAQNIGAGFASKRGGGGRPGEKSDSLDANRKPGLLNKSLIAFSTIADGLAYSGKTLLTSSGAAATQMVGHRYGPDAQAIASDIAGGVKNVGLVYVDVTGVSRRAVLQGVAKGMVLGQVSGGGQVVVGEGDGGALPGQLRREQQHSQSSIGVSNTSSSTQRQQFPGEKSKEFM